MRKVSGGGEAYAVGGGSSRLGLFRPESRRFKYIRLESANGGDHLLLADFNSPEACTKFMKEIIEIDKRLNPNSGSTTVHYDDGVSESFSWD